jgi:hypothetical protein
MSEQGQNATAFGGLVFASLLLLVSPQLIEPFGLAFGLWICLWVSPFRDTLFVWSETRRLDDEHERL